MSKSWISLLSGFVGAVGGWLIAYIISISNQHFQQGLEISRQNFQQKVEIVKLARDLNKEFYGDDLYHTLRSWIAVCGDLKIFVKKLKLNENCSINYDDLNKYLGFFDDLGYYEKHNLITIDIINQMFGHLIVEAYQKNDIKEYIKGVRETDKDNKVLQNFEYLAVKLINYKSGQQLSEQPLK